MLKILDCVEFDSHTPIYSFQFLEKRMIKFYSSIFPSLEILDEKADDYSSPVEYSFFKWVTMLCNIITTCKTFRYVACFSNINSEEDKRDRVLMRDTSYRSCITPNCCVCLIKLQETWGNSSRSTLDSEIPNAGSQRIFGYLHDVQMLWLAKNAERKPLSTVFSTVLSGQWLKIHGFLYKA